MTQEIIKWDLSDFYTDINDPLIEKDIQEIEKLAEDFSQNVKSKLEDPSFTPKQLLEWFQEYEKVSEKTFYFELFAELLLRTNNLDDEIKAFYSKIDEFKVKIQQKLLFFNLELNKISDNKFEELIKAPELERYTHALKFNRMKKMHQLSEKEEQVILMKDMTGAKGFLKLYNEFKSNFTFDFEVDGKMKKLTEAELFAYMYQENKDLRYKALQKIVAEYKKNEMIFTHIYNNILRDWDLECAKRNFKKPISRRNLENEVSDESVEVCGKVTTESYPIVEKYYNIKKKLLNLPELHMSDLYAPIGQITRKYSYQEALDLIKDSDKKFYHEFKNIIEKMVEINHIDVTPRKGKNRGAFCAHGKQKHYGFVFVNFVDTVDSVRALAHELGHAFHAYYIQREQNFVNIETSLVVAEIASVFNEMLITDYLMNTDLSKDEKISLLCNTIESKFGTSHRQNAFYRFEKAIHGLLEKKLPTTEEIKDAFVKEMELMFRNSMTNIREEYAPYIFVVPHFLSVPFYVYAYNMSNLLVISIYQMYLEQKEEFVPKYLKLLSLGSSLSPEEMLAEIGIDLNDPTFWKKGIKYLSDKIDELEKLVENN
ncbi:MAG: M3 family oligoendopeptidase [Candidatus Lokiarchaeota archaeon]|nr:M3 family oligoendopeptidase [Candidatus Lokiarchaeota archaeon]